LYHISKLIFLSFSFLLLSLFIFLLPFLLRLLFLFLFLSFLFQSSFLLFLSHFFHNFCFHCGLFITNLLGKLFLAINLLSFHLVIGEFGLPCRELSFHVFILLFNYCAIVKLAYQIRLNFLLWIIEYNCGHLELVNVKVLKPFWMTCNVHPRVEDGSTSGSVIKALKD